MGSCSLEHYRSTRRKTRRFSTSATMMERLDESLKFFFTTQNHETLCHFYIHCKAEI